MASTGASYTLGTTGQARCSSARSAKDPTNTGPFSMAFRQVSSRRSPFPTRELGVPFRKAGAFKKSCDSGSKTFRHPPVRCRKNGALAPPMRCRCDNGSGDSAFNQKLRRRQKPNTGPFSMGFRQVSSGRSFSHSKAGCTFPKSQLFQKSLDLGAPKCSMTDS